MGNVQASTAPPGSPSDFAPPPPPPPEGEKKDAIVQDLPENPGSLEDLHKKVKDLMPICFEGARVIVNKGLSNNFQVSHTLNMSNLTPKGYRFGATYVGKTHYTPEDASPILMGDIDPSGNLNAQCVSQLSRRLRGKMVAQVQDNKFVTTQFSGEYTGINYTATLSAGNLDFKSRSGVLVAQYLQNIQPRVALGAEYAYQYAPQIPGGGVSVLSLAGRYTGEQCVIAGTLGMVSAHASYYLRTNSSTQVGVEVETNYRIGDSVATLAYQMDLPKGNMVFRGMVDSTWTVGAVMEKRLAPLPFTFCMSAMLNHVKGSSRIGLGLIIG
ncbi:mitochondrial import receptor subunit TOM40 homolog 1 [Galendromus occidentalis]|uniref:Mitochondrial import receptor subunit TOM40 homolog 1 n=1 Tax=Galendromus occidentalis TaxID=34638 RepID=A0AAJ6QTA5_9ACAR|nr:mitochondrial import receptor subunit TOM40 homolog 1 [Galendromus occidentalis]